MPGNREDRDARGSRYLTVGGDTVLHCLSKLSSSPGTVFQQTVTDTHAEFWSLFNVPPKHVAGPPGLSCSICIVDEEGGFTAT